MYVYYLLLIKIYYKWNKILNIVLDSSITIDLNLITEASRVINKIIDQNQVLDDDIYEVDIYSKEKGEE